MEKYNEKNKEIYNMIKQEVGKKLTREQIEQIISGIDLENEEVPQILVTSNPYDFEEFTRRKENIFEHSWEETTRSYVDTQVLMGDYEPGIDKRYEYSNRTTEEEYEMSDFSMNQIQVAKVNRDYIENFNGSDIEEYNEYIQIYIPEEKKLPKEIGFKQHVLNKRRDKIKEILRDKISLNQIDKIIETIDLEKKEIPEIVTTSDPYEFEKKTRRKEDTFEHSWAGYTRDYVDTQVLSGDYEPGIDKRYEYSENGDNRSPDEENEMADFSMNQIQVAKVNRDYMDHFNGSDIEEYDEYIQIYIPEEKKLPKEISFKQHVLNKRREKMENKLKEILGDKINLNQIDKIIETIDFEKEKVPEIVTISDPYEFEKKTRRSEDIFAHSWAGSTRDYVDTQVLMGDYEPGIDKRYEYSENGDNRSPDEEHEMADFSMNQIQVAKVTSDYMDNFNGNDIEEHKETIQIYMPNEKEYYENVSFKKMVLEKENNEKNPIVEEISKLASKKVEIKDKEQKAKKLANEYEKQYKTLNNEEKEYNE